MSIKNPIQKSFQPGSKNISYLGKDFNDFKQNLVNLSKVYFPNTYKDFSAASPGMMFIEQFSYVGDVLSYYTDQQFMESNILFSEERKNIVNLSRALGYRINATTPASTDIEIFQMVPSITNTDGSVSPDMSYAETILDGMEIVSNSDNTIFYRTLFPVDFTVDTNADPLTISVYSRDDNNKPTFYLLRKTIKASAGLLKSAQFNISDPTPYLTFSLSDTNVIEITDVTDSDNNSWYEVSYLAQDLIFTDSQNVETNDGRYYLLKDTVPFLLNTIRSSKRFTSFVDENNITTLQFGPGTEAYDDAVITVNLNSVGRDLNSNLTTNSSFDPSNFLKTKSYGEAPQNTTLTVNYIVGGGLASNVNVNELTKINSISFASDISEFPPDQQRLITTVRSTITVNNYTPGVGGKDTETVDEIRQNAIANFQSQMRAVTKEDYIVRCLSMPAKYGSIAKVAVLSDSLLDSISNQTANSSAQIVSSDTNNNPFALNLYTLAYDSNKNLTVLNDAIRENIITYLGQYRMLTDAINVIDGFIINIGVDFEIIVYKNYNKKQVLANALQAVQNFFEIDQWTFSQPINISNIELEIAKIDGVQSVQNVTISNLTAADGNYSPCAYNIASATVNKIVYPSLDPSVFEVKFPTRDITGKVS
jgi:hypothetical protein